MKRAGAQKKPVIRRKKRKIWQFGAPASYVPGGVLAACAALSYTHASWWVGSALHEAGVWLLVIALSVAAVHVGLKQLDRALVAALVAVACFVPLTPFFLSDRQTPSRGPTLDFRHVHMTARAPNLDALHALTRIAGAQLLSFTFDTAEAAAAMPRPFDGFRRFNAAGTGDRVLWLRGLGNGNGASTVRVGACSLALEQLSLPSVFDVGRRSTRHSRLESLPHRPSHQPSVVVGHLGGSPGAFDVVRLVAAQQLRDARPRHALLGTFPTLFGPFGLPLDTPLLHGWIAVRVLEPFDAGLASPYRGVHGVVELTEPRCAKPGRRGA